MQNFLKQAVLACFCFFKMDKNAIIKPNLGIANVFNCGPWESRQKL